MGQASNTAPLGIGLHAGVPEAEYHSDPCEKPSLSNSIANVLLMQSPRHAWWAHPRLNPEWKPYEPDSTTQKRLDFGTACHALLLEQDASRIAVIDAENYMTKAAKQERDAARLAGFTPLLKEDFIEAKQVAAAGRMQLAQTELAGLLDDGDAEMTAVWEDCTLPTAATFGKVMCRSRMDFITGSRAIVIDYKTRTGTAEPSAFMRAILNEGYDLQGAFYRRGIKALTSIEPRFVYVVQETSPPYLLSLVGLKPEWLAFADHKAQRAIDTWRACMERNEWPGYSGRIAWLDCPPYAEAAWMDRELKEGEA